MKNALLILIVLLAIVGVLLLAGGGMIFSRAGVALTAGDTAPDFALSDQNGALVKLSDFRGKKNVALAFYVKAFTSG